MSGERKTRSGAKTADKGAVPKDYALPPPLQVAEKAAKDAGASTNTTPVKGTIVSSSTPVKPVDEIILDKQIEELERTIHETEEQLVSIEKQRQIQEKEAKKAKLSKQLERNQERIKKNSAQGEGAHTANKESSITIQTLRKNKKAKKNAHKTMVNLGLFSDSEKDSKSSSDSSSSANSKLSCAESGQKKKKHSKSLRYTSSSSESESESSDSEKRRSCSKSHKKKSKKRSGMAKKSSDKVKFPQVWPHSVLQFEFVSDNVSFLKLDMKIFVAGELEILTSKLSRAEYKGRMSLLKKIVYFSNIYEWKCLLQFYAAWLRRIEMGLNSWSDDPTQIETAMLAGHAAKKSSDKNYLSKSDQVWWCSLYNQDKCSFKHAHQKTVKGHPRWVKHICATCWREDNKPLPHPECSSACPHKN